MHFHAVSWQIGAELVREVLGYGSRGNGFITTAIQKRSPILGERFLRF
jgi:hypothetical protein